MKLKLAKLLGVAGMVGSISTGVAQTVATSLPTAASKLPECPGPKIQFADTEFNFGRVASGEIVRHDFIFTNIGTVALEIKNVQTSCGCTTAGKYDRQVEPGGTGRIPIQLNTTGFGGDINKSTIVVCNDPGRSNAVLKLTGKVWKPIDVTPATVVFQVSSETQTNETRVVRVVSNLEEPVELLDLQCTNQAFRAELETVRPGREFALHITALAPFVSSTVMTPVTLKTSSAIMPSVTVNTSVMVRQAVTVAPAVIMVPPGPLTNSAHSIVTVRNAGTNSLVLSEARVNAPDIGVTVLEIQPGRVFNVAVDFPRGFQIQPGQKVELSFKSNHPGYSLLHVPVHHAKSGAPAPGATSRRRIVPASPADRATEAGAGE